MNTWRNLPGKIRVVLASLDPGLRRRAEEAASCLSSGERELFLAMDRYDLAHSLAVAGRLRDDPLLHRAALLHDAGKLRCELGLATRWLYTMGELFAPRRLAGLAAGLEAQARGESALERARSLGSRLKKGLYVQLHHAEIAADLLAEAGSEAELVRLVGGHQEEPADERSRRLREVDDFL